MLSGMKGTGKTTALTAIGCREIMRRRDVWYLPITRLARIIKSHKDEKPQMSHLENCDLLLLDELHRFADLPAWIRSEGVALIDHRYGNLKQTGAAGTLPQDGLGDVLGWEIMERFDILISSDEGSYR
jgi:DNA replication protein DnaC